VSRTFATLAVTSTILLVAALVLGLRVGDPSTVAAAQQVSVHLLVGLAALVGTALVHAIVLTYFMGTGRWLEETCRAYSLDARFVEENQSLKYRTLPWMGLALLLLIATGGLGGAADPASAVAWQGWGPLTAARLHYLGAGLTLVVNLLVNVLEYLVIARNGEIVNAVLAEVRRIRTERGLPVE
jgi:hypothetical protein